MFTYICVRSKKIVIPANVIGRILGPKGAKLDAICKVTGAHIDLDKFNTSSDRVVVIKLVIIISVVGAVGWSVDGAGVWVIWLSSGEMLGGGANELLWWRLDRVA